MLQYGVLLAWVYFLLPSNANWKVTKVRQLSHKCTLLIISEVEVTFLSTKISPGAWAFYNSSVLSGHQLR